jgi:uncharacterized protein
MIIGSHVHIWLREYLPDSMVRAYLEPLRVHKNLFDLDIDVENVWPDQGVDVDNVLEMMVAGPVDKIVVLPIDYNIVELVRIDIEEYNNWILESVAPHRDQIIPLVGIDPRRGDRAIEIMERFVRRYDAKGLKVYPATGWYPNEESVMSFWKHADDLGLAVVSHAGAAWGSLEEKFSYPSSLDDIVRR